MGSEWNKTIERWKAKQMDKLSKTEEGVNTMITDEHHGRRQDEQMEEIIEKQEAPATELTESEKIVMHGEEQEMHRSSCPPPSRSLAKKNRFQIFADEDLDDLEERMNEYFEKKNGAVITHVNTSQNNDIVTVIVTYQY